MSQYDSTNIRITDLANGFVFDYELETWEVTEEFEYDWGGGETSKEFRISNGQKETFLSLDQDDHLALALWEKVGLQSIEPNVAAHILKFDEPPAQVRFKGVGYRRLEGSMGYWRTKRNNNWHKFISWDYVDDSGNLLLNIERWGEEEFEASSGKRVHEYEISNILPREGKAQPANQAYRQAKKKSTGYFWLTLFGLAFIVMAATRCGSPAQVNLQQTPPIQSIAEQYGTHENFSIILHDMDEQPTGWSTQYRHKYMVVATKSAESEPEISYSDWVEVDRDYYREHQDNLGMELMAKNQEGVQTVAAPPGYSSYVGDERYGEWQTSSSGETFWSFYGKYMMFSTVFDLVTRPIYRGYYDNYRGAYYGRNPYYGTDGRGGSIYGTNSTYTQAQKPDFFERRQQRSRSFDSRSSRGSSRYSGGSSFRSRSGGFGK
ncbi:MAG: DUF4178 domain-containing protein [Bacteroidetes bacterium]|nr:DUF4178 domain-containing protein [Bacteroidota bacterium]